MFFTSVCLALICFGYKNMLSNHRIYGDKDLGKLKIVTTTPNTVDSLLTLNFKHVKPGELREFIEEHGDEYSYHDNDLSLNNPAIFHYYKNHIIFDNVLDLRPVVVSKSYYDGLTDEVKEYLKRHFSNAQKDSFTYARNKANEIKNTLKLKMNTFSYVSDMSFNDDLMMKMADLVGIEDLQTLLFEINRARIVNDFKDFNTGSSSGSSYGGRGHGSAGPGGSGASGGPGGRGGGGPR